MLGTDETSVSDATPEGDYASMASSAVESDTECEDDDVDVASILGGSSFGNNFQSIGGVGSGLFAQEGQPSPLQSNILADHHETGPRRAQNPAEPIQWGANTAPVNPQGNGRQAGRGRGQGHIPIHSRGGGGGRGTGSLSFGREGQGPAQSTQQGSSKRRHESTGQELGHNKTLKQYIEPERLARLHTKGEIQEFTAEDTGAVVDVAPGDGDRRRDNFWSSVGSKAPGTFGAKSTGLTKDAASVHLAAFARAYEYSPTQEVYSQHTPIIRTAAQRLKMKTHKSVKSSRARSVASSAEGVRGRNPTPQSKLWEVINAAGPSSGPSTTPMTNPTQTPTPNPMPTSVADTTGTVAGSGSTAAAAENVAPSDNGTRSGAIDLTTSREILRCDVCFQNGTHKTGQCALVTSNKGDTNVDPFCDHTCAKALGRDGQKTHSLQSSSWRTPDEYYISCPRLLDCWKDSRLDLVFQKLVVERRRMPPILVYTEDFCFVGLAILYSNQRCNGEMPPQLDGVWPYTKADAVKYQDQTFDFHKVGLDGMPKGELEGLAMVNIREWYKQPGGIPPQIRRSKENMSHITFAQDKVTGKNRKVPTRLDHEGDLTMAAGSSTQPKPQFQTSNTATAATDATNAGIPPRQAWRMTRRPAKLNSQV